MNDRRLRALVGLLLIVSATVFAIGVAIERHETSSERVASAGGFPPAPILIADADPGKGEQPTLGQITSAPEQHTGEPTTPRTHPTRGESATGRAGETGRETTRQHERETTGESAAQRGREHGSERIFGINTESLPLVAIAVAVSLLLAILVWLQAGTVIPIAITAFALGAAVFDAREMFHQIDEARTNLEVIAAVVGALHLATAAAALTLLRREHKPLALPTA